MHTFVFRLIPPRPDFAMTMTESEESAMQDHVAYWMPRLKAGEVSVFGPVVEAESTWGLAVFEAASDEAAREVAENDPSIRAGINTFALGAMMGTG